MKRKIKCVLMFLCSFLVLSAQVDEKYLAGAVPEVNGKVVFQKTFELPELQKTDIYQRALAWANANFNDEMNAVVYVAEDESGFSCRGTENLVFKSTTWSLDEAKMIYQINVFPEDSLCRIEVKPISYTYDVSYKKEPEIYRAEEWITDKEAVNKKKLYRNNGKFRIKTIDFVEDVFNSIHTSLLSGKINLFRGNQ